MGFSKYFTVIDEERHQQLDKSLSTNLKGSRVKAKFPGLLENLTPETNDAGIPEKFTTQDSGMLQQANKLAYAN